MRLKSGIEGQKSTGKPAFQGKNQTGRALGTSSNFARERQADGPPPDEQHCVWWPCEPVGGTTLSLRRLISGETLAFPVGSQPVTRTPGFQLAVPAGYQVYGRQRAGTSSFAFSSTIAELICPRDFCRRLLGRGEKLRHKACHLLY